MSEFKYLATKATNQNIIHEEGSNIWQRKQKNKISFMRKLRAD
jgi:hypothetical protein